MLPTTVSASTRRLNPGLFGAVAGPSGPRATPEVEKPRLRQNRGPKLNKTEAAFEAYLAAAFPRRKVHSQAVTLLIANGCRYTPDFLVEQLSAEKPMAYEVKGPHAWDDALVKLKVAAAVHPWIEFYLVSRAKPSGWRCERVHP